MSESPRIVATIRSQYEALCRGLCESSGQALEGARVELSAEVLNDLGVYLELLNHWTSRVDLVAPAPMEQLVERHIIDSLAAALLLEQISPKGEGCGVCVDVGSGAGLPGIVFAVCSRQKRVVLCEPRSKRVSFLKEVRRRLELENVDIECVRAEQLELGEHVGAGLVISRALGEEKMFLREAERLLGVGGLAVQMLGPSWNEGVEDGDEGLCFVNKLTYGLPESGALRVLAVWEKS